MTLEDLQNKVVVIQHWDFYGFTSAKSLGELQEKYSRDDLVIIVDFYRDDLPIERQISIWKQAGGTDNISLFNDVEASYTGALTCFTIVFDSEGKQIWNGSTDWSEKPLNPDLIEAVSDAIEDKHEKNL